MHTIYILTIIMHILTPLFESRFIARKQSIVAVGFYRVFPSGFSIRFPLPVAFISEIISILNILSAVFIILHQLHMYVFFIKVNQYLGFQLLLVGCVVQGLVT